MAPPGGHLGDAYTGLGLIADEFVQRTQRWRREKCEGCELDRTTFSRHWNPPPVVR